MRIAFVKTSYGWMRDGYLNKRLFRSLRHSRNFGNSVAQRLQLTPRTF